MNERPPEERLQDLLDGLLSPSEEAELRARLGRDPALARDLAARQAVHDLLSAPLDVRAPEGLTARILTAVREDRIRRARLIRLPERVEQALVLAGAAGLAAVVAGVVRTLDQGPSTPLVGRVAVGAGQAIGYLTGLLTDAISSFLQLDWLVRLVPTLGEAAWTAFDSSAGALGLVPLFALGATGVVALILLRASRRERGLDHVSLFV
jgi:hypothetical protein